MVALWPAVKGKRVMDLACGSGRYAHRLSKNQAAHVVATDFCVPMLEQVSAGARICADMMRLPFATHAFDVVICALALGHAPAVEPWMTEVARVLTPGGVLLYSDFHPEAARVGLTRSFKDENDETCTVPHRCHDIAAQRAAIACAGLQLEGLHEIRVGEELREPFPQSEQFYRRWHGLPIVLVVRVRKSGP